MPEFNLGDKLLVGNHTWNVRGPKYDFAYWDIIVKVFDMVNHNILINLLHETFGLGDKALRWFQSYLENRFCKVKIGKDYLEKKSLDFSVPQGSCVGPVLYLSYAASISDVVSDVSDEGDPRPISIIGFADDHAMKKSFIPTLEDDEDVCIANLQACLSRVKEWMDSMRLKMNEGKTEFIMFSYLFLINRTIFVRETSFQQVLLSSSVPKENIFHKQIYIPFRVYQKILSKIFLYIIFFNFSFFVCIILFG